MTPKICFFNQTMEGNLPLHGTFSQLVYNNIINKENELVFFPFEW